LALTEIMLHPSRFFQRGFGDMARTLKRTTKERQDRERSHRASTFFSAGKRLSGSTNL